MTQGKPADRNPQSNPQPDARDADPLETQEWIDALESTLAHAGVERAHFLLQQLVDRARRAGAHLPFDATTAYINTIPPSRETPAPGDAGLERRIRSLIRWNALAMVVLANRQSTELGGHIASFASAATLYDVGFNHFFRAPTDQHGGDLVYLQGHSAPGIYARAFLEGRLSEDQLNNFRQEVAGHGLSSYPHPWLMPDFWQFSTVSMGLSSMLAIYQARLMKYMHNRGLLDAQGRKVWAFLGDGEMDEAESLGAITLAAREKLDNLIFVINCNLQRLDGPVRGNGKIIQELEALFRGAGWNVIKVVWGSYWDPLLQIDRKGILRKRFLECVDGEYQAFKAKGGAYTREKFFGKYPELLAMVASLSDEDIWRLNRGGHDPHKVFAAYAAAVRPMTSRRWCWPIPSRATAWARRARARTSPTSRRRWARKRLRAFRDRFDIPITDEDIGEAPFYRPPDDSRKFATCASGATPWAATCPRAGRRPRRWRCRRSTPSRLYLKGSGEHEMLHHHGLRAHSGPADARPDIGSSSCPSCPTKPAPSAWRVCSARLGIYSSVGQLYEPVDAEQLMSYKRGQERPDPGRRHQRGRGDVVLHRGGHGPRNHGINMIPFYCFYSMFGFQRIGDFAWAARRHARARLPHGRHRGPHHFVGRGPAAPGWPQPDLLAVDHSHLRFLRSHLRLRDGGYHPGRHSPHVPGQEDVFYYITMMNENYAQPAMPEGAAPGILKGLYLLRESRIGADRPRVQLLGSGAILREVVAAADLLESEFGVAADLWSATSFTELRREGLAGERWSLLHPAEPRRPSFVETCLANRKGPVVAATDYVRLYADQIRPFVSQRYVVLGTDGFGRSDRRSQLRHFFEVDRGFIALAALKALADEGEIPASQVSAALAKLEIDPEKPDPTRV